METYELAKSFATTQVGEILLLSNGGMCALYFKVGPGSWSGHDGSSLVSGDFISLLRRNPQIVWCLY